MKNAKKLLALTGVILLTVALTIGGTLAYLTAKTETVTNTFTVGRITATLDETNVADPTGDRVQANTYTRLMPGAVIKKDPIVHVVKGSEPCYVYVCIADGLSAAVPRAAIYDIDTTKWRLIPNYDGLIILKYMKEVDASDATADIDLPVFTKVTLSTGLDEADLKALDGKTTVLNAYLHQSRNLGEEIDVDFAALRYFASLDLVSDDNTEDEGAEGEGTN